jgi:hypothetical protein
MWATTGPLTRDEIAAYSVSDEVAPARPHRSRLVLPLPAGDADLDARIVHELTHLLFFEVILPGQSGDGGLPRWINEGIAGYMVGTWSDDHERLMHTLAASRTVPSLSQLSGSGGFADERVNDALGHAAFDYIESRWGRGGIRRFVNALIVPRGPFLEAHGGKYAYVVEDGFAVRKPIRVGGTSVSSVEIAEGVRPGDKVVIAGSEEFENAPKVKIND